VTKILSELSPSELCYIIVCARAGKGRSAQIEAKDIFLLSGCSPLKEASNKSQSAFVFYTQKKCVASVRKMLKRWSGSSIASVMYCNKKIDRLESLDELVVHKDVSVHFRENSHIFKGLKKRVNKSDKLSIEVFEESAFLCTERWV
jgi:hypothetical protein